MKIWILLGGMLLLGACGNRQTLRPATGTAPPKAATAPRARTTAELLAPSPAMRPGRSDELLTKSQPRTTDPFDLPPK